MRHQQAQPQPRRCARLAHWVLSPVSSTPQDPEEDTVPTAEKNSKNEENTHTIGSLLSMLLSK